MNTPERPTPAIAPTPRTEEAYFAKGATMYSLAGEMKLIERELAAAKEECEFRLFTLKQDGELTRLRAQESDYVKVIAEVLKCEPRSACEQPDNRLEAPWDVIARLRAEVAEMHQTFAGNVHTDNRQLRAEVERLRSDRDCEKRLRKDADEFRENAIARAERAEAELGKLQELHGCSQGMVVHWSEHAANRSLGLDQARSELAVERARLDSGTILLIVAGERVWHCGVDLRAAIDAGIKEGAK